MPLELRRVDEPEREEPERDEPDERLPKLEERLRDRLPDERLPLEEPERLEREKLPPLIRPPRR